MAIFYGTMREWHCAETVSDSPLFTTTADGQPSLVTAGLLVRILSLAHFSDNLQ